MGSYIRPVNAQTDKAQRGALGTKQQKQADKALDEANAHSSQDTIVGLMATGMKCRAMPLFDGAAD